MFGNSSHAIVYVFSCPQLGLHTAFLPFNPAHSPCYACDELTLTLPCRNTGGPGAFVLTAAAAESTVAAAELANLIRQARDGAGASESGRRKRLEWSWSQRDRMFR